MSVTSTPKGSDLELDALEKIANAVLELKEGAGEWRVSDDGVECGVCRATDATVWIAITGSSGYAAPLARAEFIATFDPPTILSLLAARKGQGEWRDIRSAPKDGTPFLAYRAKSRRAEVVRWVAPYEKAGVAFGGEFVKAASGWQLDVIWELHTHWMPLPPPPELGE